MTDHDVRINSDPAHYNFGLLDVHRTAFAACEAKVSEIAALAKDNGASGIVISAQAPARIEMGQAPLAFYFIAKADALETGTRIATGLEELTGVEFNPINPPRARAVQREHAAGGRTP